MTAPTMRLDEIARVIGPGDPPVELKQARVFILDDHLIIYDAHQGKAVVHTAATITEFTRSRFPRREPHLATTASGDVWQIYRGGCGCGSPIKKVTWRDAVKDTESHFAAIQPAEMA